MDREIIARVKAREEEAVATLVTEFSGMIAATVRRIQPYAADRENLIGEGYYLLLESIDLFDETRGVPFKAFYLLRLRHFLIDDLRRSLRFNFSPLKEDCSVAEDNVEEEALQREALRELESLIEGLSEREGAILHLFYREDLSLSEIAGFLECSYQTVANTKSVALKKLRRLYAHRQTTDPL